MIATHIIKKMVIRDLREFGELQINTVLRLVELSVDKLDELTDLLIDEQEVAYKELGSLLRDKSDKYYIDVVESEINQTKLGLIRIAEIRETAKRLEK
ncbi:MAG: hypothetical protein ACRC92_26245 [Peptostreptococcaceae bacterium]